MDPVLEDGEIPDQEYGSDLGMESFMQYPVLPICQGLSDAAEPSTGEEYLYQVRQERSRLPKVASVSYQSNTLDLSDIIGLETPRNKLVDMDETGRKQVLQVFQEDRHKWNEALVDYEPNPTTSFPSLNDETAWFSRLYGESADISPDLDVFSLLGHQAKIRLLLYHSRWLESRKISLDQSTVFNWVYCLLACLDDGLGSDQVSILRSLARVPLLGDISQGENWPVIRAIIVEYHGQYDLIA